MKRQDLRDKTLPDAPGVYFFRGLRRKILYIGRATSIKNRVRSYFDPRILDSRGPAIAKMVEEAKDVAYEETDSVLEALILEASLIKRHQPKYNTKEKSDTSFYHVVITDEDYPRVLLMRERDLFSSKEKNVKMAYGPFPRGGEIREALKIIRKIFPFRDKCTPNEGKPCFHAQIGLCPGVCTGEISKAEYAKIISNLKLFFDGKKKMLIRRLEQEMNEYARKQKFEEAARIRKTIFLLNHIQDVALIKEKKAGGGRYRIEGYDIAHMSGEGHVGVMVVVEGGESNEKEYRLFNIKSVEGVDDTAALGEVLSRRLEHAEWSYPRLIVVDGGKQQKNKAEKVLREAGVQIPVVAVVKDERHKPREILGQKEIRKKYESEIVLANSEAHRFATKHHRKKMRKR